MRHTFKIIVILLILFLGLITTTQPTHLPSVILVLPFVLIFSILALIIALLLAWQKGEMSSKLVRAGCIGASLPVILLVLQSLGQLTWLDAVMLLASFFVAYFYVSRFRPTATG
ncbi:MAG TPA: hypothetical protein VMR45_05195 [Patescibacteria group bacterium]|nr:hypothetical protein [Patescibacteria group bacterium]